MKMRNTISLLTGMLVISALQAARAEDAPMKDMAVTCPKCEMTWVQQSHQVGKTTVYTTEQKMECPDCKSAVANFFKTGKLEHTCKACGEITTCKMQQVEAMPAASAADGAKEGAVMCGKCEAVWVKTSKPVGKTTVYSNEKKDMCSGCQDMAMDMMNTGKTTGKCAKCSEKLKACQP